MGTLSKPEPAKIVIPVWNDVDALETALPPLLREWPALSIWVVDGGSRDRPRTVAQKHGVNYIETAQPSRSKQMNAGAAACRGDAILFLHADTRLPEGASTLVAEALSHGAVGGAFSRRFNHRSRFLRISCHAADWRGRRFGLFLGDQAIFASRDAFDRIGGFPDQPLLEDFEFSRRLSRIGKTVLLKAPVISSGRRFERRGPFRQTLADLALTARYLRHGRNIFQTSRESELANEQ